MNSYDQIGGGKCSLCGSSGTNKTTCPLNPKISESKMNHKKHPLATKATKATKIKPKPKLDVCNLLTHGKIVPYNNFIEDINITRDDKVSYKGINVLSSETRIAQGTYGYIDLISFTHDNENFRFIIKSGTKAHRPLEEIEVMTDYIRAMDCEDIIPIKLIGRRAIMPYVSGDLMPFEHKLSVIQADTILNIIRNILNCLARKGIYYLDIKLGNILYNCDDASKFKVLLGDMGSILPDSDEEYAASHPYPKLHDGGYLTKADVQSHHMKIYDYQFALMYFMLLNISRFTVPRFNDGPPHTKALLETIISRASEDFGGTKRELAVHQKYVKVISDTIADAYPE